MIIKNPGIKNILKTVFHPAIFTISLLRILAAFYMFINPLYGLLASWFLDIFDAPIFFHLVKTSVSIYTYIDKYLDLVLYSVMFLIGIKYSAFWIPLLLLTFKLIGHLLFQKTRNTVYFVFFPNLLEVWFVWFIILKMVGIDSSVLTLTVLVVLAVAREIYLHVLFPSYVEKNGFPKIYGLFGIHGKPKW